MEYLCEECYWRWWDDEYYHFCPNCHTEKIVILDAEDDYDYWPVDETELLEADEDEE